MKRPGSNRGFDCVLGACFGAFAAVLGLAVLMFVAGAVSVGMFPLLLATVFGNVLGEHWFVWLLCIAALGGAMLGYRQASTQP